MIRLLVLFLALAIVTAACGGDDDPDTSPSPTQAPASTVAPASTAIAVAPTPTAAVAPTAPPAPTSPPPTQAPTEAPAPTQAPQPTVAVPAPTNAPAPPAPSVGSPVTLAVAAMNLSFDRRSITVAANSQVTVNFTNNDAGVPHDFGVSLPGVAHTEGCPGPCTRTISFNSGPPGSFTFQCSIHADMVGDFTVS